METPDIFMLIVLVLAGAAGLFVVTSRNVVHSALALVVVMLGVAGTFLLLGAEFLAWTQVLVYAGAVIVLILFGLMLTRAPVGPIREDAQNTRLAFGVSLALFLFLMVLIVGSFADTTLTLTVTPTVGLAEFLYVEWAFPLLAMGFLLTVALVGAVIIARQEEGEGPMTEDVSPEDFTPARAGDSYAEPGYTSPPQSAGVGADRADFSASEGGR
jgi:NADH-quinone oxidoreductase subunit J